MTREHIKHLFELNILPLAILSGIIVYLIGHYFAEFKPVYPYATLWMAKGVPALIFIMLFIAFCKIDIHQMKPQAWHWLLLLFQIGVSSGLALYLLLTQTVGTTNNTTLIIEAAIACIICPTASAASVITGKIGGNESSTTTYILISNISAACAIPVIFPLLQHLQTDPANQVSFFTAFKAVASHIFPILTMPLVCALLLLKFAPKVRNFIATKCRDLGFYIWSVTLASVSAETMSNIINCELSGWMLLILGGVGLLCCILQFSIGKLIGNYAHMRVSAGQGLGQKNTAFGVWASCAYLSPATALAPGCYILFQNLINSFQIWYKGYLDAKRQAKGLPPYQE